MLSNKNNVEGSGPHGFVPLSTLSNQDGGASALSLAHSGQVEKSCEDDVGSTQDLDHICHLAAGEEHRIASAQQELSQFVKDVGYGAVYQFYQDQHDNHDGSANCVGVILDVSVKVVTCILLLGMCGPRHNRAYKNST